MKSPEFKNDGIVDSLTGVAAPAIFLEGIAREFAIARRDQRPLSILSLQSSQSSQSSQLLHARNALTNIELEVELIALARRIKVVLRKGEFFTRISESGFWIAVRADSQASEILATRILSIYGSDKNYWRTSIIECTPKISFEQWIESADRIHFN